MDRHERLTAYVDGELDAAARAAFERELAGDPELQTEVEQQQALRRQLAAVFNPILDEPVPLSLTLAAQAANAPERAWRAPHWAAMAACLMLGLLLGHSLFPAEGALARRDGALVVRGGLAQALDTRLAADPGPVRIGLSFRAADGRYCRSFESAPDRLAGVACREPRGWTAQAIAAWEPPPGAYRTAASETPAPVLAAVDGLISGEPFDAAAERAARDRGWTR